MKKWKISKKNITGANGLLILEKAKVKKFNSKLNWKPLDRKWCSVMFKKMSLSYTMKSLEIRKWCDS